MIIDRDDGWQAVRFIGTLIRPHKRLVTLTIGLGLIAGLFEGGTIGFLFLALKALLGDYTITQLAPTSLEPYVDLSREIWTPSRLFFILLILAVGVQLLRSGLEIGNRIAVLHLRMRIRKEIYLRIVSQIMELSYNRVMQYRTGELTTYLSHSKDIASFLQTSSQTFIALVYIVIYIGFLCWLSIQMTVITSVLILLVLASTWRLVAWIRQIAKKQVIDVTNLNARFIEYVRGIRLLHVLSLQEHAANRMDSDLSETLKNRIKSSTLQSISGPLMETIAIAGLVVMLGGVFWTGQDSLQDSLPNIMAFLFVLWRLLLKSIRLRQTQLNLVRLIPFINQIEVFLHADHASGRFIDGEQPFKHFQQDVVFENVTFQYDEAEQPAVTELSFKIRKGCLVALIGASGAGKTTVANLAMRLIDPTQGRILVDGIDLNHLQVAQWRSRMGVVSQDEFLFNLSIRDNITFGLTETDDEAVLEAARIANAHEFIDQLPRGYDTIIGEHGYRLSGGQRQRIALARAVIRDPDIFILDEATSNLDSHSESLIQDALARIRKDHTVLTIAHRLSTIRNADQILVLDHGRLVAQGTHVELLDRNDVYT